MNHRCAIPTTVGLTQGLPTRSSSHLSSYSEFLPTVTKALVERLVVMLQATGSEVELPRLAPISSLASRSLLEHRRCALVDFLGRDVFLVRGDRPYMAKRILQSACSVAIELIFYLAQCLCASARRFGDRTSTLST